MQLVNAYFHDFYLVYVPVYQVSSYITRSLNVTRVILKSKNLFTE